MRSIEWLGDSVRFIDQTKLPLEEYSITTGDYRVIAEAIRTLRLRGAPLIGISAAYGVALAALRSTGHDLPAFKSEVTDAIDELGRTRPTAVNLRWALARMQAALAGAADIEAAQRALGEAAKEIHRDDIERCERMGEYGAVLIEPGSTILTHCNTGALATGGEGTALSVIKHAYRLGTVSLVYVDETRPLLQGARLTAWELKKENIPFTLIADNMAGSLMAKGKIHAVITGADRIAANGDTANKIGTYPLAVLARYHNIPFYIAAPMSTVDPSITAGDQIPIEERPPEEITHGFGRQIAPDATAVYNPAFDVTPAELIAAIVTDTGVFRSPFNFTKAP